MRSPLSTVLLIAVVHAEAAAVELANVLGDHMVLQRSKPAAIWGTAKAGEKVAVRFAGQSKTATADGDGHWMVRLDPLEASTEPRELTVKGPSGTVTLKDVLVGDVWIAGGQSNMGRDVNRSWRPDNQRMDYPHIRFLTVASRGSKYPRTELVLPPPPAKPPRAKRFTRPNRWYACTGQTTPECCAVGFFFAERVYRETGIPQGLLWNAWAGGVAKEWIPRFGWWLRPELADTAREVDTWYPGTKIGRAAHARAVEDIAAWCRKAERAVRRGEPFPFPQPMLPEPSDGRRRGRGITLLYNGRLHPLVPYAVAGILWYQGESDYANSRYLPEIEAMVESWRTLFAAPGEKPTDLPFYFVQLQRAGTYMSPAVRDRQLQSYFSVPNSGMAVLLDLDMSLHPGNKWDAGRRLALWALARDYGKDVIYSGPLYRRHRVEGGTVVVEFAYTHGGLFIGRKNKLDPPRRLPDGKLINLEITADRRRWVPAQSRIDGEKLVVWAEGLARPTGVRYCWKSKADEPFLYNEAGLPAAQFNTTSEYAFAGRRPAGPTRRSAPKRPPAARREVSVCSVVGEGAVLQRDMEVPLWGLAGAGDKVSVTFAGQTKQAVADAFGRWRVELEAMPASLEGRPLTVEGPAGSVRVANVRVGDVWLYVSQSWHLDTRKAPVADANGLPPICAHTPAGVWERDNHSARPQAGIGKPGRWSVFRPPGRYYRNDGFYLGAGLGRATKLPVGVLAQGASSLESMTPPEGFAAFENELGKLGETVVTWTPKTPRGKQAYLKGIEAIGAWVGRTRRTLRQDGVTFRAVTQPPRLPGPPDHKRAPTTAYNFVLHRYMRAAFRGAIIQPKTFSVGDPLYLVKAKALIRGLREASGRENMPVCFLQMHNPGRYESREAAEAADWVRMRAAQNELAEVPHTTVVATYDLEKPGRSEPDMGLRAAQWAAALVAGAPVKTGPTYARHRVDGESVVVEFDNVGKGLMVGKGEGGKPAAAAAGAALGGFQLAGPDGKWHDAAAAIEGKSVVVSCRDVGEPAAVRYAWTPEPKSANLYNRESFPALPFAAPGPKAR